jgi:hypothetical protein
MAATYVEVRDLNSLFPDDKIVAFEYSSCLLTSGYVKPVFMDDKG